MRGVIIENEYNYTYKNKVNEEINDFLLNDSLNERCQNTYKKYFTLDSGVKEYKNIYLSL